MPQDHSLTLLVTDLVGILVFAISGGLAAVQRSFDIFGVVVLAVITGLGGGYIRDVSIGAVPPAALSDWRYLVAAIVGGIVVFFFHGAVSRLEISMTLFDAVGTALFAAAGAIKALDYGLSPLPAAFMGLVTGVGGGIMRDVLSGQVPHVLRPGQLYAIPAAAGSCVTAFGANLGMPHVTAEIAGAAVCAGWRLIAIRRNWQAPIPFAK